jgi:hypothetical protein
LRGLCHHREVLVAKDQPAGAPDLGPLGMTATGFPPLPAEMTARCATGYQWRALSYSPERSQQAEAAPAAKHVN